CDVRGLFHYANLPLIAGGTAAIGTWVNIRDVVADRTEPQVGFDVAHSGGERFGIFVAGTQNIESKPLRALAADSGQLLQFFNQPRHRLSKAIHSEGMILKIKFAS